MFAAANANDLAPRVKPEEAGFSTQRLALIGKVLSTDIEEERLPGAVVMIVRDGKLVYSEAFGWRDKATGVRMTTSTIFNIASMTKPMVALAALQLFEQGRLQINDPVARFFPKFANVRVAILDPRRETIVDVSPASRPITVIDLMRHTSGLVYGSRGSTPVHKTFPDGSHTAAADMTGSEFLDRLAEALLLHQPGTAWDYGFGLDVLGLMIEKITGQTLGKYLTDNVWKPLGMGETGFLIPSEKSLRYAKVLPKDPLTGKPQSLFDLTKPMKFDCGGGGAYSTASDYMRFALMLLGKGSFGGARVLGRKTTEYMLTDHMTPDIRNLIADADPTRAGYGFGLGLAVRASVAGVPMMGSVGEFNWPGMSGTNWWADPQERLAVVFMSHAPGAIRWHYRQLINTLVYQALGADH